MDSGKLNKWLEKQQAGVGEYVATLFKGGISGDGYADITNSALPADIKKILLDDRKRIDKLSDLIILYGGLPEETKATIERNSGKYLTKSYRLYEDKHWDPKPEDREGFKRWLMKEYDMTSPQADEFIEAELAYGRNDEQIRPQRKRRTRRVPTENFIRRRELSPEWKRFAGEIDRLPWLLSNTISKQATMAYNAKFLDFIADYLPDHWTAEYKEAAQKGWQNSRLPEHSYGYGKLAGKYVHPELFRYIKNEFDVNRSDIEEAIQKWVMNPFKWTKTIGSYPTHARNFLSNISLSMLARNSVLNPLNAKWYQKSVDIHMNNRGSGREKWAELIAKGVTETQFYGAEIPRIYKEVMRFEPDTWMERLWDHFVRWPIDKLGELYNFEDSLYRVAAYLHDTEGRGLTPEVALDELNGALQNYRKLPVVVDVLRRWPVLGPFISFKANVVKIIGTQAKMGAEEMKEPGTRFKGIGRLLRLAAVLAIPTILSQISKRAFNVDEKAIKELEKWYPEYRRNGTFIYFRGSGIAKVIPDIPVIHGLKHALEKYDELKVFDVSYLWPTGDIERAGKALFKGDISGLKDALDFFSHPLFDIWSIIIRGQDPQWGQKYRSVVDRAKAAAAYLYLPASMPIPSLTGLLQGDIRPGSLTGPQIKSVIDAFNQQPDQYGRVKTLPEEVKNFFTGIRTWNVEPEKLLAQAAVQRVGQIRELQSEFVSWLRKNTKAPQWEIDQHTKSLQDGINKISEELGSIKQVRDELQKTGFKATRY